MKFSISRIKLFKGCRRAYQLRYIEGLTPVKTPEALEVGKSYHGLLEDMYNGKDITQEEHTKVLAMALAYKKYIAPHFEVEAAEHMLTYDLGNGDELIGIADGIAKDGSIVEHKTTGQEISEAYEYDLQWDEQILAYMLMTGARKVYYTVCRKPTIRQKKDETEEQYFERCLAWYDEYTDAKIRLLEITRSDAEIERFKTELKDMVNEIRYACAAELRNPFYRNQGWCYKWGRRCEYASVCLNYDPEQEYVEFNKQEV
jgi:hypothetical protein